MLILLGCLSGTAQTDSTKKLKADDVFTEVFTVMDLFRYPEFRDGKVIFRDGSEVSARMNYNKLFDQFMFLNESGDSMAIGNAETIRVIVVGRDSFYTMKNSFVESLGTSNGIRFARKQTLKEVDQEKTGAYGQSYSANSTTAKKSVYTVDGKPRLNVGEKTVFSKKTEFYISHKSDEFLPASRKNIEKMFSMHSGAIREYIKQHNTEFSKESSIAELIRYIASL